MTYFARISSQIRPANRLQEYLLQQVQKYHMVLLDEPEALFTMVDQFAKQASRAYPRCTRQEVAINRSFKTKEIESISAGGLFCISIHKVAGHFPTAPAASKATPVPAPLADSVPEPVDSSRQVRIAIRNNREDDNRPEYETWDKLSDTVKELVCSGAIWAIYHDSQRKVVAEEFGGKIHTAYKA